MNYKINRMINRYGDAIQFSYESTAAATWVPGDGGPQASIQLGSTISYQGGNEAFAFESLPSTTTSIYPWGSAPSSQRSILDRYSYYSGFKNVGTGETLTFHYMDLRPPGYANCLSGADSNVLETVLSQVDFPGRTVSIGWDSYIYRHNAGWALMDDSSLAADANNVLTNAHLPHWGAGAMSVTETDIATGSARTTRHQRMVPQPNLGPINSNTDPWWSSTDFYDVVTHPDGSMTVTGFVDPSDENAAQGKLVPTTAAGQMLRMAYLKHQPREVREYAPPSGSQNSGYALTDFLGTRSTPTQSLAYRITFTDRWDLHGPGNPNATFDDTSVPHPTRTRIWDQEKGLVTVQEITGWDGTNRGYTTTTTWITRDTSTLATMDALALAFNNPSSGPTDPSGFLYKKTDTNELGSNLNQWFWNRELTHTPRVDSDSTAGKAPGYSLPFTDSPVSKAYEDLFNRVTSISCGSSEADQTKATFSFGQAGVSQAQMIKAVLSGTCPGGSFVNSGAVGADYTYDPSGYMSTIQPLGMAWQHAQTQDLFGLPQSQTDPNGKMTTFTWDSGGRLTRVHPPDGLQDTVVTPDADNLGMTVSRGLEASRYRFNGFGELALEQRSLDGGNTWSSHREFSYDNAGRRIGATVWVDGAGFDNEWNKPNLVQDATVRVLVEPGYWTTDCLGDTDAYGNCIGRRITTWTPPVYQNEGLTFLYVGTSTSYDGQGRVWRVVEPTLPPLITTTTYQGLTRTVTVGTVSTTYGSDETGRLASVTDAIGNITSYKYDPMGRISQAVQQDSAGHTQTRTWSYTPLGWLNQLIQPESGVTSYGSFTVSGKPTVTTYGAGTDTPLTVTSVPDPLGRPMSVTASDGSVNQAFVYDQGTLTNASNGKVLQGKDGGVILDYTYGGLGGALSDLNTTMWSGGAVGVGTSQAFAQSFGCDSYGHRTGGNTGRSDWTQTFDNARSVPLTLTYGLQTVATATYYDASWALKRLDYGNRVATTFGYGPDQIRLMQMIHLPVSGAAWATWGYTYDERGNLISVVDGATFTTDKFGYDSLNRLISVDASVDASGSTQEYIQSFDYDAFGNRYYSNTGQVVTVSGVPSVSYASLPSQLQNADFRGQAFPELSSLAARNQLPGKTAIGAYTGANYDIYGNLKYIWNRVDDPTTQISLNYDALGRVITLGRPDGTQERYSYTPEGLRTVIEEWKGGSMVRRRYMVYNDARQLVSEYDLVLE